MIRKDHLILLFIFLYASQFIVYFVIQQFKLETSPCPKLSFGQTTKWVEVADDIVAVPKNVSDARKHKYFGDPDQWENYRACKIPKIYPFEETALHMIQTQLNRKKLTIPPTCLKNPPRFKTDLNSTLTRVDGDSDFWKTTICCYKAFTTEEPEYQIKWMDSETCIPPSETSIYIHEAYENIIMICVEIKNFLNVLYRDYFHFFRLDPDYEAKSQKIEDLVRANKKDQLSIIYLGIDSVALTNFQRFLPKTREYLVNEMEAVEFLGLNKVGRGTLENLVPTLSGCSFIMNTTGFPSKDEECHLIWEKYAEKGYRTILSEEGFFPIIYNCMRHDRKGKTEMHYDNLSFIKGIQLTCPYALDTFGCFEHQFAPRLLQERILEAAIKLNGHLYYHHIWSVLTSHDEIGNAKYLDDPFYELVTGLVERKLLNNTLLIVTSDHGTVSSDYSRTAEGLIEARVPLLYFVFPKWFKQKYSRAMKNLRRNAQGLSTPFDVHQTLKDILDLDRITNDKLGLRSVTKEHGVTGLSLFLPISLNRTCESAHVPDEYCICWSWTQLDNPHKDISVIQAVSHTLDQVNKVVDEFSMCTRLDLEKVIDGKKTVDGRGNTLYEVIFQVIPSHGIFGAVLKLESSTEDGIKFSVVGEIERQNTYGNQSSCLGKDHKDVGWIRSACFCIDYLIKT